MKPSLHVLTHRQAMDPALLRDKTVVVLDILFATSTIVSALQAGASCVLPATDPAHARQLHAELGAERAILAGEDHAEIPPGFQHFAPLALGDRLSPGQSLVYATTNGTPAILAAAEAARHLYVGALLNAPALVRRLVDMHRQQSLLVVCSGSLGTMNLEDFYGAGCLVDLLLQSAQDTWTATDPALAAQGLYRSEDAVDCLLKSRVGRMMRERGLGHEVEHASRIGACSVVPRWQQGQLLTD